MKSLLAILCCTPCFVFGSYNGQFLQDKYVNDHFFKNKKNGVFVDIGAYLPKQANNTYFFEKELGWTGICLEPHPESFKKLNTGRKATCINAAVIPTKQGPMKFLSHGVPSWSGLIKHYGPEDINRLDQRTAELGNTPETITVNTVPINKLLEDNKLFHIDFLSLDIEGGELDVLKAIDFDKFFIDVITVENNWEDPWFKEAKNSSIRKYMESAGYKYITRLGVDEVYKKL